MNDLTDKTKWTLKDLKTQARPTDRSHRMTVELFYDGRKVGYAHNPGNGGVTVVTVKAHEATLPAQADLVELVDNLVDREVARRGLTRQHKAWMQALLEGKVFVLRIADLRAWEAGKDNRGFPYPPYRNYSSIEDATKAESNVEHHTYTDVSSAELWEMMVHCDLLWRAKLKAANRSTPQAAPAPVRDPFLGNHYIRNPQHAEEVRRLGIGRTLELSLYGDLPLTATARLEAMKLLGSSFMLVDDEIPTRELLALYIQHVVPHLPRTPTDMVDD